ncbi:hypothetical protein C1E23_17170 [Pseudoalteromonas phenolica]|uniref:HTH-like domain-containing protein n=1 Tax=Pseudoalteromonas phenolica TaxID=161398 RepID=A0A4Q7IKA3_9GAMM|nr:hypothetical protein C1E23_17170 [Pseudoalteromonas phenolica]
MCKALCVSRSGYYRFLNRAPSSKEERRRYLESHIVEYFERFKARYGAPRLAIALKQNAIKCSLNTVAKVLRERGLRAKNGRNFRYSRFSYATLNVVENVLNRQFSAASPNEKWVTDITYIR